MNNRSLTTSYITGFCLCVGLTVAAFGLTKAHLDMGAWPGLVVAGLVIGLALVQLAVQLACFLHVGHESRPRLSLATMLFTGLVITILVFGSLWIMANLHYHMLTPTGAGQVPQSTGGF